MKQISNKQIIPIVIIIGVIIIGMFATNTFSIGGGFSTLSLTQGTKYVSSDTFFDGQPTYTLAVIADGSAGSLRGTFSPSQVADFTVGVQPQKGFAIAVDINNQTCKYTLGSKIGEAWTYEDFQYPCNTGGGSYCTFHHGTKQGDLYYIDSTPHYDTQVKVSLTPDGSSPISVQLSPSLTSAEVAGVMKVSTVGSLQGTQGCPVPSSDTILYRPIGGAAMYPKPSYMISDLMKVQPVPAGFIGEQLYTPTGTTTSEANSIYNKLIDASKPQASSYCDNAVWLDTSTMYVCTPASPIALPMLKMVVKASELGVVIPSGIPKIISISSPTIEAGTTSKYDIQIQNIGTETDAFDIAIVGKTAISLSATRINLAAGQTQTIQARVQGSGIIGNYNVTATSVNDAKKTDSLAFKVKIDPFCDKTPETGKDKVSTEFGCMYVCSNQHTYDIKESDCIPFGNFETQGKYASLSETGVDKYGHPIYTNLVGLDSQLHCTGIGQYTNLIGYMDSIFKPRIFQYTLQSDFDITKIFIPQQRENLVWLPAPICNYVGVYGYTYKNGVAVPIDDQIYVYGSSPISSVLTPSTQFVPCKANEYFDATSNSCKIFIGNETTTTPITCGSGYYLSGAICIKYTQSESSAPQYDPMIVFAIGALIIGSYIIGKGAKIIK